MMEAADMVECIVSETRAMAEALGTELLVRCESCMSWSPCHDGATGICMRDGARRMPEEYCSDGKEMPEE